MPKVEQGYDHLINSSLSYTTRLSTNFISSTAKRCCCRCSCCATFRLTNRGCRLLGQMVGIWARLDCPCQALEEALAPRLRLAGDTGSLTKFGDFLSGRSLEKGTGIVLFYRVEGVLEVAVLPPGTTDYRYLISSLKMVFTIVQVLVDVRSYAIETVRIITIIILTTWILIIMFISCRRFFINWYYGFCFSNTEII